LAGQYTLLVHKYINTKVIIVVYLFLRKYVVIEFFDDGLQLVNQKWLTENLKHVYFPNLKNVNSKMYDKMVLNSLNPDFNAWKLYKIKKIWASSGE